MAEVAGVCQVCPGPGGGFAVGLCSECARPACASHLVITARIDVAGSSTSVWAVYANSDREVLVRLFDDAHVPSDDEDPILRRAWASGLARCTDCRWRHAEAERTSFTTDRARREGALADALGRAPTCPPEELVTLIHQYGKDFPADLAASRWQELTELLEPEDHEVVQIAASRGWRGPRWRVLDRVPVWSAPGGAMGQYERDGGYADIETDGYVARDGRSWAARGRALGLSFHPPPSGRHADATVVVRRGAELELTTSKSNHGVQRLFGPHATVTRVGASLGPCAIAAVNAASIST